MSSGTNQQPGPSARDRLLLAIGIGFVLCGLVLLPSQRDVGIVTIAFFGPCAGLAAATIARKRRFQHLRPLRAEIAGGIPIRPSRTRLLYASVGLLAVGSVLVVFGRGYGDEFWAIAWFFALTGASLLLGLALGWLPVGYLQFDPQGITFAGRRWAFTVPWQSIARMEASEFHDNPALFLWLTAPDAVMAKPAAALPAVLRRLESNVRWVGAPLLILPSQYELELPLLVKALERYIADPRARAELAPRAALGGA